MNGFTAEQLELIKQAYTAYQEDHPEATLEEFIARLIVGDT